MQNKRNKKPKTPEIERLYQLKADLKVTWDRFSEEIGIPVRTLQSHIWDKGLLADEDLRAMHTRYRVSLNWLVSGFGPMYVNNDNETPELKCSESASTYNSPPVTENTTDNLHDEPHFAFFPWREHMDLGNAQDYLYLWSAIFEQTLEQSGAVAALDYSRLDLLTLAQPFVLARHRAKPLELLIYERINPNFDDD